MPEPEPLELVPLGRMDITLRDPFVLGGVPSGTFVIAELESVRFEGEKLKASGKGNANADWVTISPDGTAEIDVKILLESDDGALIFCSYTGRLDLATQTAYAAPVFQTGDERYAWLNNMVAVGKGKTDQKTLTYELHEMR
ncbi:MAG TPA: DUF3237 domain-containing protein [Acidimicrobiales bacterium]|nr:DUF3237 domain-containing protein [Acidimicrobiales bacterium]